MRTIVVGDIHGCYDELMELLRAAQVEDDDLIVAAGDVVDRGPNSVAVYDWLRARERAVVIAGNHEDGHARGVLSYAHEISRLQFGDRYDELVAWTRELPRYYETDDLVVVHSGYEDGVALADQRPEVLVGSSAGVNRLAERYPSGRWAEHYTGDKPIVYGGRTAGGEAHVSRKNTYAIDTGACYGGRLTALVVPGFRLVQVAAERDYWSEQRRDWQLRVLDAKPWGSFPFDKVVRTARRYRDASDPEVAAFASRLESWAASLQARVEAIRQAVGERARALQGELGDDGFAAAVQDSPHRTMLQMALRGRLRHEQVQLVASTPDKLRVVADAFGVAVADRPRATER